MRSVSFGTCPRRLWCIGMVNVSYGCVRIVRPKDQGNRPCRRAPQVRPPDAVRLTARLGHSMQRMRLAFRARAGTSTTAGMNETDRKGRYRAQWAKHESARHCCLNRTVVGIGRKLVNQEIAHDRRNEVAANREEHAEAKSSHGRSVD